MNQRRLLWLPFGGLPLVILLAALPEVKPFTGKWSPAGRAIVAARAIKAPGLVEEVSSPIASKNMVEVSDFFRLSPKLHAASVALVATGVGLLRVEPAAKSIEALMSLPPLAAWKPSNQFAPLSVLDWVVHVTVLAFALEIAGAFFSLVQQSDEGDTRAKRTYKGYFAVYAASYAYSLFAIFSHALIGTNSKLEHVLSNWFVGGLQTASIFGSGLAVAAGPWTLLPVFAGVNLGAIGFHNMMGRILATLSIYKYFVPELPALFTASFLGMSTVPGLLAQILRKILKVDDPYKHSDANHILVSFVLGVFSIGMAFSLNRKAKYGDE